MLSSAWENFSKKLYDSCGRQICLLRTLPSWTNHSSPPTCVSVHLNKVIPHSHFSPPFGMLLFFLFLFSDTGHHSDDLFSFQILGWVGPRLIITPTSLCISTKNLKGLPGVWYLVWSLKTSQIEKSHIYINITPL